MDEISFCFYGQVKNYSSDILDSFKKNIFNPICDFFKPNKIFKYLVTFNNEYIYNPRNNEDCPIDCLSILNYIKFDDYKIIDIKSDEVKKIDEISTENVNRFGGAWGTNSLYSTKYAIRQLYSLNLIKNYKNKINVMIRPDLKFLNKINLENINLGNYDIIVPSFGTTKTYCNDRFAICLNSKGFEVYCGRFEKFLLSEGVYNSEYFLMKQFKEDNINFYKIDTKFVRIRADKQVEARDFCLFKNYL